MKPIEPGCTCIIINSVSGYNGTTVHPIKFIGIHPGWTSRNKDLWEIKESLSPINIVGDRMPPSSQVSESKLLRIDGEDFSHEKESEKELVK